MIYLEAFMVSAGKGQRTRLYLRQGGAASEPRNAIADLDPASGRSTLYTATQGPHFVRDPLAEAVLKIPKDILRLITPNVGGAFGMKAFVYPEQALVVWASRKLARPVKWQEDRSEGFVSDN
jgi:aerobic carbon-monoxide dehydrogenase large subunit